MFIKFLKHMLDFEEVQSTMITSFLNHDCDLIIGLFFHLIDIPKSVYEYITIDDVGSHLHISENCPDGLIYSCKRNDEVKGISLNKKKPLNNNCVSLFMIINRKSVYCVFYENKINISGCKTKEDIRLCCYHCLALLEKLNYIFENLENSHSNYFQALSYHYNINNSVLLDNILELKRKGYLMVNNPNNLKYLVDVFEKKIHHEQYINYSLVRYNISLGYKIKKLNLVYILNTLKIPNLFIMYDNKIIPYICVILYDDNHYAKAKVNISHNGTIMLVGTKEPFVISKKIYNVFKRINDEYKNDIIIVD